MTAEKSGVDLARLVVHEDAVEPPFIVDADFAIDALPKGWRAQLTVLVQRTGRPRITALTVRAAPRLKAEPLTTSAMRSLPLQRLLDHVVSELSRRGLVDSLGVTPTDARGKVAVFSELPRPGRRGRSAEDYMNIVAEYVHAMHDPDTARAPVPTVARRLHLAPKTVNNLIAEAARRGLISGRQPGRPGFDVTPKGIRALESAVAKKTAQRARPEPCD